TNDMDNNEVMTPDSLVPGREPGGAVGKILPAEFHADLDALCPKVRTIENKLGSIWWASCRPSRRYVPEIDDLINLLARPNHVGPVDKIVTGKNTQLIGQLVAE